MGSCWCHGNCELTCAPHCRRIHRRPGAQGSQAVEAHLCPFHALRLGRTAPCYVSITRGSSLCEDLLDHIVHPIWPCPHQLLQKRHG